MKPVGARLNCQAVNRQSGIGAITTTLSESAPGQPAEPLRQPFEATVKGGEESQN